MQWHPIETCPKDGREFLAYDPVVKKFDVCVWADASSAVLAGIVQTQFDGEWGVLSGEFDPDHATLWAEIEAP